ncbi:ParB/RepB/Spo0J family partition protein [Rothia kristinae]|uniref:ParB/RepB/Spo0J family partition protein n=2 Tax=Rothia kristinae TaxID=37923 RepID=UPI0030B9740A
MADNQAASPSGQGTASTSAGASGKVGAKSGGRGTSGRSAAKKASAATSASGAKNGEQTDNAPEKPQKKASTSRSAKKSGRSAGRADMGAALRKSGAGRRPVDFFFEPSAAAQETKSEDPRTAEAGTGERGSSSSSNATVSRETAESSAGTSSTNRRPDDRSSVPVSASASTHDSAQASKSDRSGTEEGEQRTTRTRTGSADAPVSETDQDLVPVPGALFGEIPVRDIHPNRKQPRQEFDPDDMDELVHSIREIGVLQPIVIRPSQEDGPEKYELVMGERRWRASQEAGLDRIPAIIRETQDIDLLRDALLENLHRSQLNPLEEAAAYQQLLHEFGTTQEELARRIGRSRPQISNTIRLLRLPTLVQRRVAAGVLSSGHARALLALSDPAAMERLAQRIVAEGLSVRSVEEIIQSGAAAGPEKKKRRPSAPRHHERFDYIADAFADKLDTSVKIALGARKGKMTIEFASVDDLNRIISVLDPEIERG